ncbi:MFS transporter [Alteromonas lipolytica]|uniref:Major facilitator superfamily (MFS) profile domain-containing protein n=1 Tax=Alteromonas lipolytica TaxID=1856405 RepID=A0A1E8FI88_9ALTE|nr:MFS transporter [Alteromonas lipolytica]OFI35645.1 hypothetical protein BFC17_12895 [Alteromonas lipolytica]GGF77868.1 MFS transporter [Alteromonas lipolytica]
MQNSDNPLSTPVFRRAWFSSVFSNIGLLIQGVGVAWAMVEIASSDAMVTWVQAATYLPLMLLSIPAGAIADVFNKRSVATLGLAISFVAAAGLLTLALLDAVTPFYLLALCMLTGVGMAIYDPAWQTAVPNLVPPKQLPSAIALRSISQNLARAIGPAIGGVLVAWAGVSAAFSVAALSFLPFLVVMWLWQYQPTPPRLPPERVDKAIVTGLRFVFYSPASRVIVFRGFIVGALGIGLLALMPLAAKYLLKGDSVEYGIILASFGFGAVAGARALPVLRQKVGSESMISLSAAMLGIGALSLALIPYTFVVALIMVISGMGWLITFATLNTCIQTVSPRWVMGRALATYSAATTSGIVLGSLLWGELIELFDVHTTLLVIAVSLMSSALLGKILPIPDFETTKEIPEPPTNLSVSLNITHRSGPIYLEKEYKVFPVDARKFYRVMHKLERQRKRNGAYDWSLSRDISDSRVWIERYHMSTWLDYLRMQERYTERDDKTQQEVQAMLIPGEPIVTRHRLERPIGSVRWTEEAIDSGDIAQDGADRH